MNQHDHPTLRRLDSWTRGLIEEPAAGEVASHVTDCEVCTRRVGRAGPPIDVPRAPEHEVLSLAAVPEHLHQALVAPENPEPAPGQLWRLAWDGTVSLGLVLAAATDAEAVRVAPVAEDPHMGDDETAVVPAAESLLGIALGVWLALERDVPVFVLHVHLGDLANFDDVADAHSALLAGHMPAAEIAGPPITSPLDERAQFRSVLDEALGLLAAAEWMPPVPQRPRGGLHGVVEGLPTSELSAALDLETDEVHEMLTVGRFLSDMEAEGLAALTGVSPDEARAAAAPEIDGSLVVAINRPRRRPSITADAARRGCSEAEERRWLLARALPVAARRAGPRAAPLDWDSVLDDLMLG